MMRAVSVTIVPSRMGADGYPTWVMTSEHNGHPIEEGTQWGYGSIEAMETVIFETADDFLTTMTMPSRPGTIEGWDRGEYNKLRQDMLDEKEA